MLKKILWRWVNRKSPKIETFGGTPAAVLLGVVLMAWLPAETAAAVAAPAGALLSTLFNLLFSEGPDDESATPPQ